MTNDGTTDHHALYTLMITNVCAVSHYVKHLTDVYNAADLAHGRFEHPGCSHPEANKPLASNLKSPRAGAVRVRCVRHTPGFAPAHTPARGGVR